MKKITSALVLGALMAFANGALAQSQAHKANKALKQAEQNSQNQANKQPSGGTTTTAKPANPNIDKQNQDELNRQQAELEKQQQKALEEAKKKK